METLKINHEDNEIELIDMDVDEEILEPLPLAYVNLIKAEYNLMIQSQRKGDVGRVVSVHDGIVRIKGLSNVRANEMISFSVDIFGVALNLEVNSVGALIFGSDRFVNAKSYVFRTGQLLSVPVGFSLLGRVVDGLGRAIDGKGLLRAE